jgi:hypothetical protein
MADGNLCPFCDQTATVGFAANRVDVHAVQCARCGNYLITGTAELVVRADKDGRESRWILSALTRMATKQKRVLELTTNNIPQLLEDAPLPQSPAEVADRVLLDVAQDVRDAGWFAATVTMHRDQHLDFFLRGFPDLQLVLQSLANRGLIEYESVFNGGGTVRMTLAGWERVDELRRTVPQGFRAFVAMSYDPALRDVWTDGIKPALEETGYEPIRVDELQHNEKIDDRIIAELRLASLVVADFTQHKGGVYFECGYAMGRRIPVIWCCRENDIGRAHFDTRQYYHITWSTPAELHERLRDRIGATMPLRAPLRVESPR